MKIESDFLRVWVLFAVFLALQPSSVAQAETETESAHRIATAIRITNTPPQLDGILDDDIWQTAPLHEGFRQRDPDEGEPVPNAPHSKSPTTTKQSILESYAMTVNPIKSFLASSGGTITLNPIKSRLSLTHTTIGSVASRLLSIPPVP